MVTRADLLVKLVMTGSRGDTRSFHRAVEAIIAEERSKQHHVLADRLAEGLKVGNTFGGVGAMGTGQERVADLVYEIKPVRTLNDLILPDTVARACRELVEEQHRRDLLRSYNLEPRHRVLLIGPPGNGKTSLAEALATELMVPLFVIRYEGITGGYPWETGTRLQRLFEFARGHHCVLFFDEFDAVGRGRDDERETEEMRWMVNSLASNIDSLPSHVVLVTATNHSETFGRALWRRFQLRLELPKPDRTRIERWLVRFEERFGRPLGYAHRTLSEKLVGLSLAEIEEFGLDIQRRYVLSLPDADLEAIVRSGLERFRYDVHPEDEGK